MEYFKILRAIPVLRKILKWTGSTH